MHTALYLRCHIINGFNRYSVTFILLKCTIVLRGTVKLGRSEGATVCPSSTVIHEFLVFKQCILGSYLISGNILEKKAIKNFLREHHSPQFPQTLSPADTAL